MVVIKRSATVNTYLHLDIVQSILLRLPIKPLARFKTVCKSWNDMISDNEFGKNYIQQSKQQNIFLGEPSFCDYYCLFKFENDAFQVVTKLQNPWKSVTTLLCSADGLVLLSTCNPTSFLLWNPSTKQNSMISCPHTRFNKKSTTFGFCRGPTWDDYKIVALICDSKKYTVYSCKTKAWTKEKEFPLKSITHHEYIGRKDGLFIDGFSFWFTRETIVGNQTRNIIFYFDPRSETFKKLEKPRKMNDDSTKFFLTSFKGCLCLYDNVELGMSVQQLRIWMLRDNNVDDSTNSWSELMVIDHRVEFEPRYWITPPFYTEKNELMIHLGYKEDKVCIYNSTKKKIQEIVVPKSSDVFFKYFGTYEHADSLFFPQ